MTTAAPLVLSSTQQHWLTELQVPAPFVLPFVVKPPKQIRSAAALRTDSQSNSNTKLPEPVSTISARAALQQAMGSAVELRLRGDESKAPLLSTEPGVHVDVTKIGLTELEQYANQCQACALHRTRHQAVVGSGQTQHPDWMVISTAPSSNEEVAGLPMQGKSGELFSAQMQSIGINSESQLYLTQLIKCRSQTTPEQEYLHACFSLLKRQIELIKPQRLLLLGSTATQLFLQKDLSDGIRGRVHQWQSESGTLPVVASFHPASILLRPQLKALVWTDLLLMRSLMKGGLSI